MSSALACVGESAMRLRYACAVALTVLVFGLPASAADIVGSSHAKLTFGAASGPVAGYFLYFQYEGDPVPGRLIGALAPTQREVTVAGNPGHRIIVRVRPYAADGTLGPFSLPSETIYFVPDYTQQVQPNEKHDAIASIFFPLHSRSRVTMYTYRSDRSLAGTFTVAKPQGTQNAAFLETRVARCDLDGDGRFDFVFGYANGSRGHVEIREGASSNFRLIHTLVIGDAAFHSSSGATFPACGDIDGDGLDEVLIGRGPGGGGIVDIFDDENENFAPIGSILLDWPEYVAANGETRPALGDVDADGRDEVVIGLGAGGDNYLAIRDDQLGGFRDLWSPYGPHGWLKVDAPSTDGSTTPAVVQLDADIQSEIIVGLGVGSGGMMYVFDDGLRKRRIEYPFLGFPFAGGRGWLDAGWSPYASSNGTTRPAGIDINRDGIDEVMVAHGAGGLGQVRMLVQGAGGPEVAGSTFIRSVSWQLAPNGTAVAR
ncbi:MAG: VCBS repeat-containing protein [Myxococcota bacterium]|nr:VCBS repeat-containing protein [Myxococcota bacterium]